MVLPKFQYNCYTMGKNLSSNGFLAFEQIILWGGSGSPNKSKKNTKKNEAVRQNNDLKFIN